MRIAIDARFYGNSENADFLKEVWLPLAKKHAQHQFVFLFASGLQPPGSLPPNVETVLTGETPPNILSHVWSYYVKTPAVLKKAKADVFISSYGAAVPASIPLVVILHHFSFTANKLIGWSLKRAKRIASPSDRLKEQLAAKFILNKENVTTIPTGAAPTFKPLEWEQREDIKSQYAQGCEYFIFAGGFSPNGNLINTLKAFSIFKKWQKTNMKLLVTGKQDKDYEKFSEKLTTYKYRSDVIVIESNGQQQLAELVSAAYAMVFPPMNENTGAEVIEAMQCEVPVITAANSVMSEIAGDAALYVDPANPAEMAEQMKRIFKDEQLRADLILKGKQRLEIFNWQNTRTLTWQLIEAAVSK